MADLRAGLIGLGMMGRHHARVLGSLDGVELVGVADPAGDPHNAAGGREVHKSIDDLIALGLDYCMVAVPTVYHEEIGLRLAEAGVHALIEKPLAASAEASDRLADAFEKAGLIGGVGHIERYNPSLQNARKRIEAGDLGEVYQVITRRQGPFPGRIADVGVVKDLGSHDVDLTAWVVQSAYKTLAAQTAYRSGREHEDMVTISAKLENGIMVNNLVNWLTPFKERTTVITGEKGSFVADTLTADLTFYANGKTATSWDDIANFRGVTEGDVIRYAIAKPEPLRTEHEAFRDAVLGKEADIVTFRQGANTVRVCEAAIASGRDGGRMIEL